jgi:hypothetical protein
MRRLVCGVTLFALAVAPALADPKGDVMGAMVGLAKATSYHITISSHNRPSMEADMQAPGKMHMVSPQFEFIKIDTTTWVKMNGTWQKFSLPNMDQMIGGVTGVLDMAHEPDQLTVTDLGPKTPATGGPALHAYSVVNEAGKSPATMFIDGGRLVEVDNTDGSSVKFSKFNDPVDIEPPS